MPRVKDEAAIHIVFEFFTSFTKNQTGRIDKKYQLALACLVYYYATMHVHGAQTLLVWATIPNAVFDDAKYVAWLYNNPNPKARQRLEQNYSLEFDVLAEADRQLKSEAEFKKLLSKRDDDNDLIS